MLKEFHLNFIFFTETLRLYPNQSILSFECEKDYDIEETKQTIKRGTPIVVPVLGLHRDFNYFKDPDSFIPERFQDGNSEYFNEEAFISFKCLKDASLTTEISLIAAKIALVHLLTKYKFSNVDNMPIEFNQYSNFLAHPINLRIENRLVTYNDNTDCDKN